MALRTKQLDGIGTVTFQRRRGAKNIRMRVQPGGKIVVTLPLLVPYIMAERFVLGNSSWLIEQQATQRHGLLIDGQLVGRVHMMRFIQDSAAVAPRARVLASRIEVRHSGDASDDETQTAARKAAVRALRREGERYLTKRLADIARAEGYAYASCRLKQLKGRWGSCDQSGNIVLNIYLMQLPDELIDYVLYHELAHLHHLNHSRAFWQEVRMHLPDVASRRAALKRYAPTVPALRQQG